MDIPSKKIRIYKKRNPVKIVLLSLLGLLAAVLLLAVIVFFWFQKYIVYTTDGLRLEIPWLEEMPADTPDDTEQIEI